jgi:hypothetical protein
MGLANQILAMSKMSLLMEFSPFALQLHLSPNHQSLAIFQEVSLIGTCVLAFTFGGHFQPFFSCLHMPSTTIQLTPHFVEQIY